MTEDHVDRTVEILARSASNVLINALKDEKRFRKVKFLINPADEVELREYLKAWALARKQD